MKKLKSSKNIVYYNSSNPADCTVDYIIMMLFCLLPLIIMLVALYQMYKLHKHIKNIKYLIQHGTLFKNLPYTLVPTNLYFNHVPILAPAVDFTLPSGFTVSLVGDPRHDGRHYDKDGLVDLLIDLDNPENYYIDFEINHK